MSDGIPFIGLALLMIIFPQLFWFMSYGMFTNDKKAEPSNGIILFFRLGGIAIFIGALLMLK